MMKSLKKYKESIERSLIDIGWAQWNRLGVYGVGKESRCITDFEAAIVFVSYIGRLDGRLFNGALSWIHQYQDIVSGERLKIFIKEIDDSFLPRSIGAIIESATTSKKGSRWNHFLSQLKKSLPKRTNKKGEFFWLSGTKKLWTEDDPIFKQWGLIKEQTVFTQKLRQHEMILRGNNLVRYRYLFGTSARADVIYLVRAATKIGRPLMTSEITALTGYHHTSVYRILQDLMRAGVIEADETAGPKNVRWFLKEVSSLHGETDYDKKIINWLQATSSFIRLFKIIHSLETEEAKIVAKHRYYKILDEALRRLRNCGFTKALTMPTGPLKDYEISDFFELTATYLQSIAQEIISA